MERDMNDNRESTTRWERRKPRYSAHVQVLVFTRGLEHFLSERTANISEGGLFICTEQNLEIGERVHIRVILSDKDSYFDVKTRVAWACDGSGSHPKGLGLELMDLNAPQRSVIEKVLRHYVNVQDKG